VIEDANLEATLLFERALPKASPPV
jgi:hypothetical protein